MGTYGEISWEDDFGSNSEEKKVNSKDLFLRLESGDNVVRLVTKPFQYIVHKGVKKDGDKGFGQKVSCSNPDGKGSCPVCDLGLKATTRWFLGVIDKKTTSYKVLDISYQVYNQIRKLARNTKIWGDPEKYDLNIIVDKNGGPTGYYSVQPNPHKDLTPAELQVKEKVDVEDLKRRVMPPTVEVVQRRLDKLLEGGKVAMPVGVKPAGKGKPVVEVEDTDNMEDVFPDYNAQA